MGPQRPAGAACVPRRVLGLGCAGTGWSGAMRVAHANPSVGARPVSGGRVAGRRRRVSYRPVGRSRRTARTSSRMLAWASRSSTVTTKSAWILLPRSRILCSAPSTLPRQADSRRPAGVLSRGDVAQSASRSSRRWLNGFVDGVPRRPVTISAALRRRATEPCVSLRSRRTRPGDGRRVGAGRSQRSQHAPQRRLPRLRRLFAGRVRSRGDVPRLQRPRSQSCPAPSKPHCPFHVCRLLEG